MVDVKVVARGDSFLAGVLGDDFGEFRAVDGVPRSQLPGLLLISKPLFPSLRQFQGLRRYLRPKIIKFICDLFLLEFLDILILFILEAHEVILVILTKLFDSQFASIGQDRAVQILQLCGLMDIILLNVEELFYF